MCGIAGIVRFDPRARVEESLLARMGKILHHRGPDGEGVWIEGPAGLAHRRLAIVDVEGGRQPMTNEDGTVWITYNGEIYNHDGLRRELQAKGHRYRTRSDTETIVHLYEEEGERCVEKLRGMFAFAIWDRKRGKLLLARDRLGIKPLYYALTGGGLFFASEIKAILAAGEIEPAFNEAILPEFLATRFVSGEETFFRGIRKLRPGHTAAWSLDKGFCQRRYWRLPVENGTNGKTLAGSAEEVREGLKEAVRSHLMSDVPLGVFLSGGIDSSAIAVLMASMVEEPIRTFSVGFAEREANELPYARIVAQAIGADHHEVLLCPDKFFGALPRLIWHEDEPIAFPSSVPLYFVSRLARDHVKVVLTGEGSDEIFLGYPWYRVTAWNDRLGRPYWNWVPETVRRNIAEMIKQLPKSIRRYGGRSFLALNPGPRGLFYENFAVFSESFQDRLFVRPELFERDPYGEVLRCFAEAGGSLLSAMSHADLQTYLVELLMKQDQMSMAASIESRVPFLDHGFVEQVVSLPDHLKLRGLTTKAVLRAALRDVVPREILTRRKMGFPTPIGDWLRGPFSSLVDEFVLGPRSLSRGYFDPFVLRRIADEHRSRKAEHGDRLWLLVNLEVWQRIFLDHEAPEEVMPLLRGKIPEFGDAWVI